MSILIGFLTFILVVNCLFLILLVLIQLPKKEAGAGLAFGGAATDALFGAGSGTALTKITKYCAGGFMGLSLLLAVLNAQRAGGANRALEEELRRKAATPLPGIPVLTNAAPVAPASTATTSTPAAPLTLTSTNAAAAPSAPSTIAPPATTPADPATPPAEPKP